MPQTSLLESFIATPSQVESQLVSSQAFREFFDQAVKSSGSDPQQVNLAEARYRYTDSEGVVHEQKPAEEMIWVGNNRSSLAALLTPQHVIDRKLLIHALWNIASFEQLKIFLKALGGIVRYSAASEGPVTGHLLLSGGIIPMIESVERREYVLPNGDMASDAITRALGLRAKVFALDRQRRVQKPEDTTLLDRLTRTLARIR